MKRGRASKGVGARRASIEAQQESISKVIELMLAMFQINYISYASLDYPYIIRSIIIP